MTIENHITASTASNGRVSIFRLRPCVQRLESGLYQAVVVIDDGGSGSARFGDGLPTLKEASDAACGACEAALPAGEWADDGWFGA